jgi:protein-L-isoaspartate(D-aspartate) O-methyltransferase
MTDFAAARRMMVEGQIRTADVTDPRLLAALFELPRERFLPASRAPLAYLDIDVPLSEGEGGRRLLKPMVLAKLIQAAEIAETDRVLDVGCGSGYSTMLLAALAEFVVGVEEDATLSHQAQNMPAEARPANIKIVTGSLPLGAPKDGPFDVIMLEGAVEVIPATLVDQLKKGGRLLCVLGRGPASKAMLYRLIDGDFSGRPIFDAAAPLLPGFAQQPSFVF